MLVTSCRTARIMEQVTIRERVVNNSFEVWGISKPDPLEQRLYILDTMLNENRILATFNIDTKEQSIKYEAKPDTLRDTTQIITQTEIIKEVPLWVKILLAILVGMIIMVVIFYKLKK